MKLYFENSYGEIRIIAEPKTEDEAWKEINKFCDDRKFNSVQKSRQKTLCG